MMIYFLLCEENMRVSRQNTSVVYCDKCIFVLHILLLYLFQLPINFTTTYNILL